MNKGCNCQHGINIDNDCEDCNKLFEQLGTCKYCGDLIPKVQMGEHHKWCIPMITGKEKKNG